MTDRITELDRQVQRGSMFTQAVLQRTSQRVSEAEAILARVIDQLAGRGLLDPEAMGLMADEPVAPDGADEPPELPPPSVTWPAVAVREDPADEERSAPAYVDCEARMHVCGAVCCRLKFPLSAAEVEEGSVKWDIGHPYLIRHESDGYCTHNDRETHGCHVYDRRPTVCRTYSCAGDKRIWADFDAMVLNHAWIDEHLATGDGMYLQSVLASMDVPVELTEKPA
ncbi:MAG: YkgJ family cysteine cluster protein [Acidimicrobiales bacterium]